MASKKDVVTGVFSTEDLTIDLDVINADDDEEEVMEIFAPSKEKPKVAPVKHELEEVASGISDLITDIDDKVNYLTWVIYGKNGTGKTTLLSTTDGVLVLASEDGTLSIRDKSKGKAKKVRIDTWEKLEQVYWLLHNAPFKNGGLEIPVSGGKFTVKTVAFDTMDRLAEVCMRNVVLGEKEKDPDKDILKKTLKNWGDMGEKMKFWLQQFEELPVQRVLLCQETSNSDDVESDEYSTYPALNKSLRNYVQADADIIARTYIAKTDKGMQFRLSALPNAKYVTKDRTNRLGRIVANPNLDKLYATVFSEDAE